MNQLVAKLCVCAAFSLSFVTRMDAQEIKAQGVPEEARRAVQLLMDVVRRGDLKAAGEQMYPQWKKRLAARVGGEHIVDAQLEAARRKMQRDGISIESYTALPARDEIGVGPGKGVKVIEGQRKEVLVKKKWLVFVPTVAVWRVPDPETGKIRRIERQSFQVAIREKSGGQWAFIDGAQLSLPQLRALFPGLPAELLFPSKSGRELK